MPAVLGAYIATCAWFSAPISEVSFLSTIGIRQTILLVIVFIVVAVSMIALDSDPERVRQAAAAGDSVVFGDAARREVLVAAAISRATAVVVTFAQCVCDNREITPHSPRASGRTRSIECFLQSCPLASVKSCADLPHSPPYHEVQRQAPPDLRE